MAHLTPPPSKGNTPLRPGSSAEPAPSPTRLRSALADLPEPGQPSTSTSASASGSRVGSSPGQPINARLPADQMDVDASDHLVSPQGTKDALSEEEDELSDEDDLEEGGLKEEQGATNISSDSEEEEQGVVDSAVVFGSEEEEEMINSATGHTSAVGNRRDVKGKGPVTKAKGGKSKKSGKGKGGKSGLEGRGKENELYEADIVYKWNNRFGDVVWDADHPKPSSKRG